MEEKQEKQAYLRSHILQPGYDPTQFVNFLNTKLPIGDNLDLCSFEQLQAIVDQFIAQKKREQQTVQHIAEIQESLVELPIEQSSIKSKQILFTNYSPHLLEHEYKKTFQCNKIIDNFNHLKSIKCVVQKQMMSVYSPERKNTGGVFGIGGQSFLEFKVLTIQPGWKVGRRYSDFIWLRQYLRKIYPTFLIPPVPEKKASKRTQRHIEKRMKILEYFLNDLVSIKELLNDAYVVGFLNLTDQVKFQNLKKQSGKVRGFESISDMQNFSGKVNSKLSEDNKKFCEQIQKKVPEIQKIYKEITRGGKALQQTITSEVNKLYELGNHFADLHEITKDLTNKISISEPIKTTNDIFITLNNMMIEWGNVLRNQHQFLEKNFNTFFKYLRNELYSFTEIYSKEQELEMEFNKYKAALERKKQKIFNLHDPQKWDLPAKDLKSLPKQYIHDKPEALKIMLPKENANLQKMRTHLFLYIDQLYENGLINFQKNNERYCENFKQFAIKIKVNNQQLGQMWMEMSANFSEPKTKSHVVKCQPSQELLEEYNDDL